jgi:hypothetical protein
MGRIRTVKPEFWANEALSAQPEPTHLLAGALLNYADDEGFFNANIGLIKAACSPLREPSVSIQESLTRLSAIDFLRLGSTPDGRRWGFVVKFTEHQRVNRPTPSKIRDLPIEWDDSETTHGALTEPSLPEGKGKEQGKEQGTGKRKREVSRETTGGSKPSALGPEDLNLHPALPLDAWAEWIEFRRTRRMPCDRMTLQKQLNVLAPLTADEQRVAIDTSIQSNWQGLFPRKINGGQATARKPERAPTPSEIAAERARAAEENRRTAEKLGLTSFGK